MSLVLLLGLSLGMILQIEIASNRTHLKFTRATLASDLAIQIASGQLQSCLKYDQRVNAPAGIIGLGCEVNHRSWSGVWQTNALKRSPIWLVSGNSPQPELPNLNSFEFRAGYDHEKDNSFNGPFFITSCCKLFISMIVSGNFVML